MSDGSERTVITFKDMKELLESHKCKNTHTLEIHAYQITNLLDQINSLNRDTDKIIESQQKTEEILLQKLSSIEKNVENVKIRTNTFQMNAKKRVDDLEKDQDNLSKELGDLKTKLAILESNINTMKTSLEVNQGKLFTSLQDIEKVLTPETKDFLVTMKKNFENNNFFWKRAFVIGSVIVLVFTIIVYGKEIIKMIFPDDGDKAPKVEISDIKEPNRKK